MGQIGQKFQEARQSKNLTLEELQQVTKIRMRYLEAMEAENWDVFPGEVYLKGFLKGYAMALGLNSQEILQLYQAAHPMVAAQPALREMEPTAGAAHAPHSTGTGPLPPRNRLKTSYQPLASNAPRWGYWAAACGLVIVLACTWLVFSAYQAARLQNNSRKADTPPSNAAPATTPVPPNPLAAPPASATPSAPVIELAKVKETAFEVRYDVKGAQKLDVKVQVKLTAAGEAEYKCWMEAQSDGQNVGNVMMTSGKSETYTGSETVKIRLGNPTVTELTVNGLLVPPVATVEPVDLVFMRQP